MTHIMLTDTKLRAFKAKAKSYRVADSHGLVIEVRPTGAKVWRYRYRYAGKPSIVSLDEYPAKSLIDARAERDKLRKLVKAGTNPADAARAAKAARAEYAANTFGAIAAELIDKREREGKSAGTIYRERQWLKKDLAPYLGTLPIKDVTVPVLLAALRRIESRAVETAHRARGLCVQVFRYAVQTGRAERNVADDTRGALTAPKAGHFASITEPAQVAPLLRAMWNYTGTPAVNAAIKLAPILFVRPGELRTMRWADVDLDAAEWRYTTSKTGTAHIVPLASQAVGILRELHPLTSRSEYVFPSARGASRPMSENAINVALRTMGYDGETMTGHGFRAMARTILDEVLGFRPDYIEHQLAHAVRDPNGRAYNRTAHLPARHKMMQAWADYLDALRTGADVVSIRKAS
jgi:integrase